MNRELDGIFEEMRRGGESAPARVEQNLLREFRALRRRRNVSVWLLRAAMIAVPLAIAVSSLFFDRPARPAATAAREVTTEFYPLGYGSDWTNDGARVVRVRMPRSTVVSLGFPALPERSEDRVTADLVVSFDGTARAVRFVRLTEPRP